MAGMTVVQKILARATGRPSVAVGDVVEPAVDLAMSHENAALVINQFQEIYKGTGLEPKVWDPSRSRSSSTTASRPRARRRRRTRRRCASSSRRRGSRSSTTSAATRAASATRSSPENGYVRPGMVVVGTDSHTTTHGALGAFAFGIGATEMASVWALGSIFNVEVPATIKVVVNGALPAHVLPKDLILHLIGKLTAEGANFKVIEFHGEAIRKMPASGRLVLCNMSVEAGATAGIVAADEETVRYLREEAGRHGPARGRAARRGRRVRPGDRDRRLVARAADRLPAHGGQREADRRGRRQGHPADRDRLVHQRPPRRPGDRRRDPARAQAGARRSDAGVPGLVAHLPGGAASAAT